MVRTHVHTYINAHIHEHMHLHMHVKSSQVWMQETLRTGEKDSRRGTDVVSDSKIWPCIMGCEMLIYHAILHASCKNAKQNICWLPILNEIASRRMQWLEAWFEYMRLPPQPRPPYSKQYWKLFWGVRQAHSKLFWGPPRHIGSSFWTKISTIGS